MTNRRPNTPSRDQAALFVVDGGGRDGSAADAPAWLRRLGSRHEDSLDEALADLDEPLADRYAVAVTTLRALCRALDVAEAKGDAYAAAQLAPRVVELLDRLGLAPVVDDGDPDDDGWGDGGPE